MGQEQRVVLVPRTRAARLYGVPEAVEPYYCNYGVNPDYRLQFEACGLRVSGVVVASLREGSTDPNSGAFLFISSLWIGRIQRMSVVRRI